MPSKTVTQKRFLRTLLSRVQQNNQYVQGLGTIGIQVAEMIKKYLKLVSLTIRRQLARKQMTSIDFENTLPEVLIGNRQKYLISLLEYSLGVWYHRKLGGPLQYDGYVKSQPFLCMDSVMKGSDDGNNNNNDESDHPYRRPRHDHCTYGENHESNSYFSHGIHPTDHHPTVLVKIVQSVNDVLQKFVESRSQRDSKGVNIQELDFILLHCFSPDVIGVSEEISSAIVFEWIYPNSYCPRTGLLEGLQSIHLISSGSCPFEEIGHTAQTKTLLGEMHPASTHRRGTTQRILDEPQIFDKSFHMVPKHNNGQSPHSSGKIPDSLRIMRMLFSKDQQRILNLFPVHSRTKIYEDYDEWSEYCHKNYIKNSFTKDLGRNDKWFKKVYNCNLLMLMNDYQHPYDLPEDESSQEAYKACLKVISYIVFSGYNEFAESHLSKLTTFNRKDSYDGNDNPNHFRNAQEKLEQRIRNIRWIIQGISEVPLFQYVLQGESFDGIGSGTNMKLPDNVKNKKKKMIQSLAETHMFLVQNQQWPVEKNTFYLYLLGYLRSLEF
jgi:hypothetical protein